MTKAQLNKLMDLSLLQHHEIERLRKIEDAALLVIAQNMHLSEATLKPLVDAINASSPQNGPEK
jgi:hypothetical protein